MAPTSSIEERPRIRFDEADRERLLQLTAASIAHGLAYGRSLPVNPADYPARLREPGAAFVTLHLHGRLRGCIGSLEAYRPLVEDVAENAFAAAFRDPRFPPVTQAEFPHLDIEVSVLSPPEPLPVRSEAELLTKIRPGVDGLILEEGMRRGTFLPAVWESLPDPRSFVSQLKLKAGLPLDYWSDTLRVYRYHTEAFHAPVRELMDDG